MGDIHCGKCGEPWGTYAVNHSLGDIIDMDAEDVPENPAEYIKKGKGCPTCNWGEKQGEVSLSRNETPDETDTRRIKSVMNNTDEDPIKYI